MRDGIEHNEEFGQRIKRLRKERGYSQIALAEQVGVTDAWISQIEMGRAKPSAELINQLARTFKVPVRELLQEEELLLELCSRIKLVEVLLETSQPDEAESILVGLQVHEELSDVERIQVAGHLAECYYQQGRFDEILDFLIPIVSGLEAEHFHDAHLIAWLHNKVGKVYFRKQDMSNALYHFRKAYDLTYQFATFDALAANIAYNVGITLQRVGNSQDAIYYFGRSQDYFKANNRMRDLADSIFDQGIAYKGLRDYAKAVNCFDQARAMYFALNQMDWAMRVQMIMAYSVTMEQDAELGLEQLVDCSRQFEAAGNYRLLLFTLAKIVFAQLSVQDVENAGMTLQRGQQVMGENSLQDTPEAGEYYRVLAQYCYARQEYTESIKYATESSALFAAMGMVTDHVQSLQIAVDAHQRIGNWEQALTLERSCSKLLLEFQGGRGV